MNFKHIILSIVLLVITVSCIQPVAKNQWTITYKKTDVFIGNCTIKIGTDSCYYESTFSFNKRPVTATWKSNRRALNALYNKVAQFDLQKCSPLRASITEEPFETMELVQNDRIVFSIQKEQQRSADVIKFDSVVAILKSFASAAQGWQY